MPRAAALAPLLGALSSLPFTGRASAYTCTPVPNTSPVISQAWNQRCIPYWLNDGARVLAGPERRLLVAQSFSRWSEPSCTDLELSDFGFTRQGSGFDPTRRDNENVVMGVETERERNALLEPDLLALTLTSFSRGTGEIFDADIIVNAFDFEFEDLTDAASCTTEGPLPFDLRNTLVHEIGHFIGFDHSTDGESTMFGSAPACETKKRDLAADDVLGACGVYPAGQPTETCAAPPRGYDVGGDVSLFRDQCAPDEGGGGSACSCRSSGPSVPDGAWALLFLALLARRTSSGR